jgi:acetate---CoA ligase (ADP-forming)
MTPTLGAVRRMLEPRSVAVVGASARSGSFGERLALEALRSPASPVVHLVNPGYDRVLGQRCVPSLADIDEPVDLVMLGVPDALVVRQLEVAAGRGAGGAVVFGPARGLGARIGEVAGPAGLAVCGGGCMGFVNVVRGIRAIGYVERAVHEPGPVALVTHSGSVFSALLRTHRRLDFSVAVSSGQELVTTTADYLDYALDLEETRCVALFLETLRQPDRLRAALVRAADAEVPVVALAVGASAVGGALVSAHSGALAGSDGGWEALFAAHGVHRVHDLEELADTVELFAVGRRVLRPSARPPPAIATVHDSGGERVLVADLAAGLGLPFAPLDASTRARLEPLLDPSLQVTNPLDVWGTGHATEELFVASMTALADDPGVDVVVMCVDLVEEYDGDESYPNAAIAVAGRTAKPVIVLSAVASALDQRQADRLRNAGVPVLEGLHSGLRAIGHLLAVDVPASSEPLVVDEHRRRRWAARLGSAPLAAAEALALLGDYGIATVATVLADRREDAVIAADEVGYPVVLKTAAPGVDHKVDVGGVVLALGDAQAVGRAYDELADRLGPQVIVQPQLGPGAELAVGVVDDPLVGPLVLLAAGGTMIEVMRERSVALPPVAPAVAATMLDALPIGRAAVAGMRGRPPIDRAAVEQALVAIGRLALELGGCLRALDVNPLVCGPSGAVAVDCLVVARPASSAEVAEKAGNLRRVAPFPPPRQ